MNGRTKWGSFLAGLSLSAAYILGCATAQVVPTARAAPPEGVQQWSYECTDGYNPETIMTRANALGQEGWELVAGVGSPRALGLWCFKRPT